MITRIKTVLSYTSLTETQFARKLGMTQSAINRVMRGTTEVTYRLIYSILENYPEISAEWLMRGDGPMLKGESQTAEEKRLNNLVDVIAMQQETIRNLQNKIKELQTQ